MQIEDYSYNGKVCIMSHSKLKKPGFSIYLNKWNPSAKKYINICSICGSQGYSPVILAEDFYNREPNIYTENRAIYKELTRTLKPLPLDSMGRCEICAKIQEQTT